MFDTPDEARLFREADDRLNDNLSTKAKQKRLRALHALGHTQYELQVLVDAHEPYRFLFTRPPTLIDVATIMAEFNILEHIVSIRVQTKRGADVPPFLLDDVAQVQMAAAE